MPCLPESVHTENKRQFPLLNEEKIEALIKEYSAISASRRYDMNELKLQRVPTGFSGHTLNQFVNRRRIDVIKDCVSYIFDNKISDARKVRKCFFTFCGWLRRFVFFEVM